MLNIAGHQIRLCKPTFDRRGVRTDVDASLPYYSHSIMEAINTCPKWGLIRYKERKYYKANFRALALEAGSAMHEVFAALRLWQLKRLQGMEEHFRFHGARIFGETRLNACFFNKPNPRDEALSFCFEILNSGEYYDDPGDQIRTMSNMEETTIRYVDEQMSVMDKNSIWVADPDDPTAPVGIEIALDMVIDETIRFIGTIDGVVNNLTSKSVRNEENKTASRLDEAWREKFRVNFQPTGYMLLATLYLNELVTSSKVIGIKLKQTRSHEDYRSFIEHRNEYQFTKFFNSLYFTHAIAEQFKNNAINAPMFTHSCSRYFRPCGFIDLCSAESEEDHLAIYNAMERTPLSPSEQAIIGVLPDE